MQTTQKITVKVQLGWTHIGPETTSPHLSTRKKHDETVTSTNTATCNSYKSTIVIPLKKNKRRLRNSSHTGKAVS